jgi:serine protease Do
MQSSNWYDIQNECRFFQNMNNSYFGGKVKRVKLISLICFIIITVPVIVMALPVTDNGQSPFVSVVKNVRDAVVQIKVEAKITTAGMNNSNPNDFFKFFFPDMPQQQQQQILRGSGFIFKYDQVKQEVYILTNNHVIAPGKDGTITVTLADKANYTGEIIGVDRMTDVGVLKVKVKKEDKIVVLPLGDSSNLEIGDWAIAIGNPFDEGLERTVTVGVISAIGRANLNFGTDSPVYQDYIQTDAAINPGNSGGPLINIKSEVIGINAAITSPSGGNNGIGFAIPINLAKKVADDLIKSGKVVRAYMGISPQEITPELRSSFNLPEIAGVLVAKVEDNTPASKAGLKNGDVIEEFNNIPVTSVAKFRIAVAEAKVGSTVPVKIIRNKTEKTLNVQLEAYPEDDVASKNGENGSSAVATGLSVDTRDSAIAKQLKIDSDKGVVVSRIEPNSPAYKAGLAVGDVIIQINDTEVNSISEYNKALADAKKGLDKTDNKIILLYVKDRTGNFKYVTLNMG